MRVCPLCMHAQMAGDGPGRSSGLVLLLAVFPGSDAATAAAPRTCRLGAGATKIIQQGMTSPVLSWLALTFLTRTITEARKIKTAAGEACVSNYRHRWR